MWLFLSDAMFSIVQPDEGNPDELIVRARFPEDIKRVFPAAIVAKTPRSDYLYRAIVERDAVREAVAHEVDRIAYPNFKDSVDPRDGARHDAYLGVWTAMYRAQEPTPRGFLPFFSTTAPKKKRRRGKKRAA